MSAIRATMATAAMATMAIVDAARITLPLLSYGVVVETRVSALGRAQRQHNDRFTWSSLSLPV